MTYLTSRYFMCPHMIAALVAVSAQLNAAELQPRKVIRVLKVYDDVTSIELSGPDVADQDLEIVREIPGKKFVSIWAAPVTDSGMTTLSTCPDIVFVQLRGTLVTSEGIDALASVSTLQVFQFAPLSSIPKDGLSDFTKTELNAFEAHTIDPHSVIASICRISSIGHVYLEELTLTNADFQHLSTLNQLQRIVLLQCSIDQSALTELKGSSTLRALYMPNTQLTNDDLSAMQGIQSLTHVAFDTERLDDTAIELLRQTSNLREVVVNEGEAQQDLAQRWNSSLKARGIEVFKLPFDWKTVGPTEMSASNTRLHNHAILSVISKLLPIVVQYARDADGRPHVVAATVPDAIRRPPGDATAAWIGDLKTVRAVDLADCHITDSGLKYLTGLKHLETLGLRRSLVTNEGVKHLAGLKHLEILSLESTSVSDEACESLTNIRSLDALQLAFTKVTDKGVQILLDGTNLTELDLEGTAVTGNLVGRLSEEQSLMTVYVGATLMTGRDIERLRQKRNDMDIIDSPRLLVPTSGL